MEKIKGKGMRPIRAYSPENNSYVETIIAIYPEKTDSVKCIDNLGNEKIFKNVIIEEGFIYDGREIFEGDKVRIQYINYMNTPMSLIEKIIETEIVFKEYFAAFGYYEDEEFQFINHRGMKISVFGTIHDKSYTIKGY